MRARLRARPPRALPSVHRFLAEGLLANRTLVDLDITMNRCLPEGARGLADALRANRTLTALRAGANDLQVRQEGCL